MVETFDCPNTNLKQGSMGEKVTLLQTHLKNLGYYVTYNGHKLVVDGVYGTYTAWAVKNFQKDTGHSPDGWFGPKTCASLVAKINQENKTGTSTSSTNSGGATQNTVVTKPVDPYAVDTSKNVYNKNNSNLAVDGIFLLVSGITFSNEWKNQPWKRIDLLNGGQYRYLGNAAPREYSVDVILKLDFYNKLSNEFYKMMHRECNVVTSLFPSGRYTVEVSLAYQNVRSRKLTFKFVECI